MHQKGILNHVFLPQYYDYCVPLSIVFIIYCIYSSIY